MHLLDFKTAWSNLRKNKFLSVLNLTGLGTGLAVAILIFNYAYVEFQADKHHEKLEQIYVLHNENRTHVAFELAPLVAEQVSAIKEISMVFSGIKNQFVLLHEAGNSIQSELVFADEGFTEIFDFELVAGNLEHVLGEPTSIILTESEAKRLFGEEDPIGQELSIKAKVGYLGDSPATVKAVIGDLPDKSNLQFGSLVSWPTARDMMFWMDQCNWGCKNVQNYVLLNRDQDPAELAKHMSEALRPFIPEGEASDFSLLPYGDVYFSSVNDDFKHGNLKLIYTLASIALLILLIATINYINLSLAGSSHRLTEVGLKKMVGVEAGQLRRQFMGESVLISLMATLLGLVLAWVLTPSINSLAVITLPPIPVSSISFWLVLGASACAIGLIAGVVPAFALSKFKPIALLTGKSKNHYQGINLKRVLIVFQFIISIALIICTFTITRQLSHMRHTDMGFESENVIHIKLSPELNYGTFKEVVQQIPGVEALAYSRWYPGNVGETWGMPLVNGGEEKEVWFACEHGDANYIDLMGLEIVQGRKFTDRQSDLGTVILNEAAVKEFGLEDPLAAYFQKSGRTHKIVGVVKDFHFQSLHNQIRPLVIFCADEHLFGVNLKLAAGDFQAIQRLLEQVHSSWKKASPSFPFDFVFLDEQVESLYRAELAFQKIFRYGAIFAIFISCLGLFGLVLSSTEERRKEIGIRRVNGANVAEIMLMLNRDFLKWVGIAFFLASPAAWFIMRRWLENFAYRTTLSWWIFALAGLLTLAIALLTVSWQSWKTATRNPVEALRYE